MNANVLFLIAAAIAWGSAITCAWSRDRLLEVVSIPAAIAGTYLVVMVVLAS